MLEGFKKTIKSSETEDWLDYRVIRPLSYLVALLFAKLDIHPNTVTIWSMIIGASSAYFFGQASYYYNGTEGLIMNIIAIALLMWADIFDCTDGQLARLTGKKSPLGRILDGLAGYTWFIPIYAMFVYRFYLHHTIEFGWLGIEDTPENALIASCFVFVMGCVGGFLGMGSQTRLADYYIQVHLFLLKGEQGCELDNSIRQKEIYDKMPWSGGWVNKVVKIFQRSYIDYTKLQEKTTPEFQKLMAVLKEKYGSASNMPAEIREELHRESKAIMGYNGALTFNFRESWLFLFCLLDIPVATFFFETIAMSLLAMYINRRHEGFCKRVRSKIEG